MLQFENDSGITSSTKSSSSTCTITYRPATVQDVPEAAALITLGRADNPLEWACYPDLYSSTGEPLYTTTPSPKEELEKLTLSRRKMFHDALDNPETHRLWVAVASSTTTSSSDGAATGISNTMENDTSSVGVLLQKPVETKTNGNTSRIVGFIIWQLCPQGNSIEKWQEIFDYRYNLPPFDDFMKIINPVSKEIIGIDVPYLCKFRITFEIDNFLLRLLPASEHEAACLVPSMHAACHTDADLI